MVLEPLQERRIGLVVLTTADTERGRKHVGLHLRGQILQGRRQDRLVQRCLRDTEEGSRTLEW